MCARLSALDDGPLVAASHLGLTLAVLELGTVDIANTLNVQSIATVRKLRPLKVRGPVDDDLGPVLAGVGSVGRKKVRLCACAVGKGNELRLLVDAVVGSLRVAQACLKVAQDLLAQGGVGRGVLRAARDLGRALQTTAQRKGTEQVAVRHGALAATLQVGNGSRNVGITTSVVVSLAWSTWSTSTLSGGRYGSKDCEGR